jgi:3-oxoacyl-[acyl-carrier-protein] synthase-3
VIARVPEGTAVGITGIGACIPERVLTNADIAKIVDTSDEWIVERTGIRERRIAEPDQAPSDLAVPAARQALERAGVRPEELDLILVATAMPDMIFPATASLVGERLGATNAAACDIQAACTGFVYALTEGYASVASRLAGKVLVIGAETLSRAMNWKDRTTCILFGDAAAAVVLEPVADGGFLGFELGSDGSGALDLSIPGGGARYPATADTVAQDLHFLRMNGKEVFRFATRIMVSSAEKLLEECRLTVADVDVYVPHQANRRIIDHAARHLGIPSEKVLLNVDRYGNTSSASIPLALYEGVEEGTVAPGMKVLMTGVGGGLSWGSALMVWGNGK